MLLHISIIIVGPKNNNVQTYVPPLGPAPVATYFRPRPPLAEGGPRGGSSNAATALAGANGDLDEGATKQENNDTSGGEADSGGGGGGGGAEENTKPIVADGKGEGGGAADDGQKWELFEDDRSEHTARFRGRKLV